MRVRRLILTAAVVASGPATAGLGEAGAVWMLQRYAKRFLSRTSAWGALLPRASADASLIAIRPVRLAFA